MMDVGFIGVGDQGGPMAEAIAEAGFPLHIWTRRPEPSEHFRELGATIHADPAALAACVDLLCLCVVSEADIRNVLFERGTFDAMRAGSIIAVHSTMSPQGCGELAAEASRRGLHLIDAPVSGARAGAIARRLLVMIGGDKYPVERTIPVFNTYASRVVHLGPVGAGQTVKLLNNLILNANFASSQFVLELGEALGLERAMLRDVLLSGTARSTALEFLDTRVIPGQFDPTLGSKDIALAADLAKSRNIQRTSLDLIVRLALMGRDRLAGGEEV